MPASPFDWNVTLIGAWNLAILTPAGIARRLFGLPQGQALEVLVPLEGRGPIRVTSGDITVVPSEGALVVTPLHPTKEALAHAAEVATRALQDLPETPVFAAGVNIRYAYDDMPTPLIGLSAAPLDDCLSGLDFRVPKRAIRRSILWAPGELNLDVSEEDNASGTVTFNYHLAGTTPAALTAWISRSAEMFINAQKILAAITSEATIHV
jgi:hypothetical protein